MTKIEGGCLYGSVRHTGEAQPLAIMGCASGGRGRRTGSRAYLWTLRRHRNLPSGWPVR